MYDRSTGLMFLIKWFIFYLIKSVPNQKIEFENYFMCTVFLAFREGQCWNISTYSQWSLFKPNNFTVYNINIQGKSHVPIYGYYFYKKRNNFSLIINFSFFLNFFSPTLLPLDPLITRNFKLWPSIQQRDFPTFFFKHNFDLSILLYAT